MEPFHRATGPARDGDAGPFDDPPRQLRGNVDRRARAGGDGGPHDVRPAAERVDDRALQHPVHGRLRRRGMRGGRGGEQQSRAEQHRREPVHGRHHRRTHKDLEKSRPWNSAVFSCSGSVRPIRGARRPPGRGGGTPSR